MSLQEQLHTLYLLDQRVRGLRTSLDASLRTERVQQTKLNQLLQQRDELASQVKLSKAKAADLENQVNQITARVDHLRGQMNSVKNHKEYSALLVEVSTIKNDKSKLEDAALTQLSQVDMLNASLATTEEKVAVQQKQLDLAKSEVVARRQEVGSQLDQATQERDEAQAKVPEEARAMFLKQADVHDGEAMATIVEENKRLLEYTCGGCYMGLPIERINTAISHPETVVSCPSCGRLLFVDPELRKSMGHKS